jgi:hypothetical protein
VIRKLAWRAWGNCAMQILASTLGGCLALQTTAVHHSCDQASRLMHRICVQVRQAFVVRISAAVQISASDPSPCRLAAFSDRFAQGLPSSPNSCEDMYVTSDTGLKLFTVSSAGSTEIRLFGTRATQASEPPYCLCILSSRYLHLVHSRSSI